MDGFDCDAFSFQPLLGVSQNKEQYKNNELQYIRLEQNYKIITRWQAKQLIKI